MLKRILALVITFTMLFTTTLSFAASSQTLPFSTGLNNSDEKAIIQEVYASLSDEAKLIFDAQICKDETLYQVQNKYIGNADILRANSKSKNVAFQSSLMATKSSQNALDVLKTELAALSLSSGLYYALMAEGASLVAAGVDGPLPVGDVVGLVVGGLSAIVIAFYANEFMQKYDGISRAFSLAFTVAYVQIKQALDQIYQSCVALVFGAVTISGQTVTANGITYNCTTRADYLTEKQRNLHKYYPALLYNENVYVDLLHGMDTYAAKGIIMLNNEFFGVWANTSSYSRGLCGGDNAIFNKPHGGTEGYYYHYHHPSYRKSHCWYLY